MLLFCAYTALSVNRRFGWITITNLFCSGLLHSTLGRSQCRRVPQLKKTRNVETYPLILQARSVPLNWTFIAKVVGPSKKDCHENPHSVLRWDKQNPLERFGSHIFYALVAAHETMRLFLVFIAVFFLLVGGTDVDNAYIYGEPTFSLWCSKQQVPVALWRGLNVFAKC